MKLKAWVSVNLVLAISVMASAVCYLKLQKAVDRVVAINAVPECETTLNFDTQYLASIIAEVINAKGSLPNDHASATKLISESAVEQGFAWPYNFQIDASGHILNCLGEPFEISILPDRVSVSCGSLYAYYFAPLKKSGIKSGYER